MCVLVGVLTVHHGQRRSPRMPCRRCGSPARRLGSPWSGGYWCWQNRSGLECCIEAWLETGLQRCHQTKFNVNECPRTRKQRIWSATRNIPLFSSYYNLTVTNKSGFKSQFKCDIYCDIYMCHTTDPTIILFFF